MGKIPGETMKILLAIRSMSHGGGAEALVFNIYNELKRRPDIKVKIVAFRKPEEGNNRSFFEQQLSGNPDFYFCDSNVSLSLLGKNKFNISEFVKVVNSFKPHIIHSHLFIAELVSREKIFPAAKYFTHTHDNMKQLKDFSFQTLYTKELLTNFYEKKHLITRYAEANNNFIAISEDTKSYFEQVLPQKLRKNIFHLENAIVIDQFKGVNSERDLKKIRIVNVGGFLPKKNQAFLVDICEELVGRGLEVEVKMLGDGEQYENVKALVNNRKLQNYIAMLGNVVNVRDHYGWANIYVHTANYEPFGLVLLEAMASGLPVVSLDGKGNRVLIKEGVNGHMIYEQDKIKFADVIEKIMKDEKLYRTMSGNAVAFAGQYDIVPYVDKLLQIYEHAA
jgi:glycosyltransferase involved in cell wall biosynthesis